MKVKKPHRHNAPTEPSYRNSVKHIVNKSLAILEKMNRDAEAPNSSNPWYPVYGETPWNDAETADLPPFTRGTPVSSGQSYRHAKEVGRKVYRVNIAKTWVRRMRKGRGKWQPSAGKGVLVFVSFLPHIYAPAWFLFRLCEQETVLFFNFCALSPQFKIHRVVWNRRLPLYRS